MNKLVRYIPVATLFPVLLQSTSALAAKCGGVEVSEALGNCPSGASNPIFALIALIIKYATGIIGLVLVLMVVIAGLQYVISDGSPDVTKSAKDRLKNAITGLVLFILMSAALQILLPPDARLFNG